MITEASYRRFSLIPDGFAGRILYLKGSSAFNNLSNSSLFYSSLNSVFLVRVVIVESGYMNREVNAKISKVLLDRLPDDVRGRLQSTFDEVDLVHAEVIKIQKTKFQGKVSFRYKHSAPIPVMSLFERAQSVCFIAKYENLPSFKGIEMLEHNKRFFLRNIDFVRHVLNEYRPIVQNQKDSIYYSHVHKYCYGRLQNRDSDTGLSVSVFNEEDEDVTNVFVAMLGEKNRAVKYIIENCEFDYLYNGILQHSDNRYTKRFWEEYSNGRINHIFIKHASLLGTIKSCLMLHYQILNQLTFPKLGPL